MNADASQSVEQTVEAVARASYGRLVAYLASRSGGDVAGAEDALAEAFYKALTLWPERGIPLKPEAWLLHVARNHEIDEARKRKTRALALPDLWRAAEEAQAAIEQDIFPDDRLKLLFVCAHPAIDPAVRTPLLLQTVLGFDSARIASAFLLAPTTMGQRLVRAKTKIREAGIAFAVPEPGELPARLEAVLEAIYAVYGQGWEEVGSPQGRGYFVDEAFYLARVLVKLLPREPEARGLLALMLYCESRRDARRAPDGAFVPLSRQDTTRWSRSQIEEAETLLREASTYQRMGRFQLEAAIQSAHTLRRISGSGREPLAATVIAQLYDGLVRIAPTVGASIGRAAAVAEADGPEAGLTLLDALEPASVQSYQPFWAAKAHLLQLLNRPDDARHAFDLAIGLTEDPALRQYLLTQRQSLPAQRQKQIRP